MFPWRMASQRVALRSARSNQWSGAAEGGTILFNLANGILGRSVFVFDSLLG